MKHTSLIGRMIRILTLLLFLPAMASSHCDTMNGPVVKDAKLALATGDVTPVLKWIKKEHEPEIIASFEKTRNVRTKGIEAQNLADMYFFETLVRIHRAGEGAPYTGLKPEGTHVDHSIEQADKAIETHNIDNLVQKMTADIASGMTRRFNKLVEAEKHAHHSVDAGRDYVAAYVEFIHYIERIQQASATTGHSTDASSEHKH